MKPLLSCLGLACSGSPSTVAPNAPNGGTVVAGVPDDKGWVSIPLDDPHLLYNGRIDRSNSAVYRFAYPAVSVRAHFVGTGISLSLKDHGGGTPTSTNYYDVTIDGAAPTLLPVSPDQTEYPLADGLVSGEHTVELFKRIESAPGGSADAGLAELQGFRVPSGTTLLPVAVHAHRIEAIGDSITCGYGVELSTMTPDSAHFTSQNENAHHSYVALAAGALDAEYSAVAYSGRGMSRNYADSGGLTIPDLYELTLPDGSQGAPWDPTLSVPDVVVINVGTNDFSTVGVDRDLFRSKYASFLAELRVDYPNAPPTFPHPQPRSRQRVVSATVQAQNNNGGCGH